jgi:hypothetical protein
MSGKLNFKTVINFFVGAVLTNDPKLIISFLNFQKVKSTYPDKQVFYDFFRMHLIWCYEKAEGKLVLSIDPVAHPFNDGYIRYKFYDETHLHPVFILEILEEENSITFNLPPF